MCMCVYWQAERDHHTRDTYNYLTVQTDIRMPKRQIRLLEDSQRHVCYEEAIQRAVQQIKALDLDVRVLNLGAGSGGPTWVACNTCPVTRPFSVL
jgi:protein arginine N-methyltransferase 7